MGRSKSGLFLMELIIAIAFFAIASAVCIQLFAAAHTMRARSFGLQMAVASAQGAAEAFKVTGDLYEMSGLLEAALHEGRLVIEYDENWAIATGDARYAMTVEADIDLVPAVATITVTDRFMDEELYTLTVIRYQGR